LLALATIGFGLRAKDDEFTKRMQKAFNVCLSADSAETLKEEACRLKDVMNTMKMEKAADFGRMLEAARAESLKGDWLAGGFAQALFNGIAKRAAADPNSKPVSSSGQGSIRAFSGFTQL
jgi:hypothetical protein